MKVAKLFFNGGSQAVRLPKAFRFEGIRQVMITREEGRIILFASDDTAPRGADLPSAAESRNEREKVD